MTDIKGIQNLPQVTGDVKGPERKGSGGFGDVMKKAIEEAASIQDNAEKAIEGFAKGDVKDIHTVVLAMEKADMSLNVLMEVRNKLVSAYEDIMKLQI